jgi:hypothetical protein
VKGPRIPRLPSYSNLSYLASEPNFARLPSSSNLAHLGSDPIPNFARTSPVISTRALDHLESLSHHVCQLAGEN